MAHDFATGWAVASQSRPWLPMVVRPQACAWDAWPPQACPASRGTPIRAAPNRTCNKFVVFANWFLRADCSIFRPRTPISLTATHHARRPGTKTHQAKLVGKINPKSPGWFLQTGFCKRVCAFFGPEHRFPLLQHIMLAGPERKPSKLSLWEKEIRNKKYEIRNE